MLYEAILIAIILSITTKGKISNLASLELKYIYLPLSAFVIKYGLDYYTFKGISANFYIVLIVQLLVYFLLFAFLYLNHKVPGRTIIFVGFMFNFLVIMSNKGAMPTSLYGLDPVYVDMLTKNKLATHIILTNKSHLPWLGDVFLQTFPAHKKFSIGDVFISIGVFYLVWATMHTRQAAKNYRVDSFLSKSRL